MQDYKKLALEIIELNKKREIAIEKEDYKSSFEIENIIREIALDVAILIIDEGESDV